MILQAEASRVAIWFFPTVIYVQVFLFCPFDDKVDYNLSEGTDFYTFAIVLDIIRLECLKLGFLSKS
jgi:hypothetical protein